MPPKSKSIFRQPGAKHFQLVHRSQRDPLIHDPEASQHVLKAVERGNERKGKTRADLEHALDARDLAHDDKRANIGEAAAYGIYFDDTNYDYMKHLKPVGVHEDGVESILLEAPSQSKAKGKSRAKEPITLLDLPAEALPSTSEVPRNYETQQAVPSSIAGFQPDMDPHLRQVLEALEDEEFVDEELEDDFFGELVADGERDADEYVEFDFAEDGLAEDDDEYGPHAGEGEGEGEEEGWEARFARFKKEQKAAAVDYESDLDEFSDGGDTIGSLPQFSVLGGKKRRKGASDASGYSMSSSSMFRNEGLTTLDERFDQIQKEYESDEDEEDEGSDADDAPELITSREDFNDMMNEFLENYEILGGKMRPVLAGDTPTEKLDTLRKALGEAKIRDDADSESDEDILMPVDIDEEKDRWDCETILSTYSNLENHPRLISARKAKSVPKIELDPKTGLPIVDGQKYSARPAKSRHIDTIEEDDEDDEDDRPARVTVTRSKDESKEEKKARKQAVKAEKQQRRVEKKVTKEQFSSEIKQQAKRLSEKEKTKMRKL
ncbi:LTV domain-containing protein [Phanerochaete sordida]|uniref:LTV domain-containing protein n=1 Tax=Phanerochaete sordida TaxID=48140 RepID=A0A9P3L8M3_9APHY|nr:LTV domain-containing protein [Phanerochaete sordida]